MITPAVTIKVFVSPLHQIAARSLSPIEGTVRLADQICKREMGGENVASLILTVRSPQVGYSLESGLSHIFTNPSATSPAPSFRY
jgi:hypothetical protein